MRHAARQGAGGKREPISPTPWPKRGWGSADAGAKRTTKLADLEHNTPDRREGGRAAVAELPQIQTATDPFQGRWHAYLIGRTPGSMLNCAHFSNSIVLCEK